MGMMYGSSLVLAEEESWLAETLLEFLRNFEMSFENDAISNGLGLNPKQDWLSTYSETSLACLLTFREASFEG